MRVFLSELAENKLLDLTDYLLKKWSLKVKNDFVDKFSNRITQIALYPESCIQSNDFEGLYRCVVSKQTTFFYRVDFVKEEIEIITLFDTRQTPDKLSQDL